MVATNILTFNRRVCRNAVGKRVSEILVMK